MLAHSTATAALTAMLTLATGAFGFDDSRYPDLRGEWNRRPVPGIGPSFDPTKAPGLAQQAPLTPEYQKILEASLADLAAGGGGFSKDYLCISSGMPMRMTAYQPLEFIIADGVTHIAGADGYMHRRIYTDGRAWPKNPEPSRSRRPRTPEFDAAIIAIRPKTVAKAVET